MNIIRITNPNLPKLQLIGVGENTDEAARSALASALRSNLTVSAITTIKDGLIFTVMFEANHTTDGQWKICLQ